jgi:alginate O-acetyltransferase complex protein AlgI
MLRLQPWLQRYHFCFVPLQSPGTTARLRRTEIELMSQMHLLRPNGSVLAGADAFVEIARQIGWLRPLPFLARLPGVLWVLRWLYARLAANRYCLDGACRVRPPLAPDAWLSLLILPLVVWLCRARMADWVFMWAMACALFAACKWLTFRRAVRGPFQFTSRRAVSYLFGWVGLDPAPFIAPSTPPPPPSRARWLSATMTAGFGTALVWLGVRHVAPHNEFVAGWTGMVGIILLLHFGLFRLLALAWQRAGVPVQPLMNAPALAANLGEFWGKRWNTGFNVLVRVFLFRPWVARGGRPVTATLLVFLFSGLVHELVISIPARGGYGLPTAYFLLQAAALLLERSAAGRRAGLGDGWQGHWFALALVTLPLGWLFPPVFVHHVILPMLRAIGAY